MSVPCHLSCVGFVAVVEYGSLSKVGVAQCGSTCTWLACADVSSSGSSGQSSSQKDSGSNNGFSVVAQALARLGIKHMYGVVGIPVTELASAAQVCLQYPSLHDRVTSFFPFSTAALAIARWQGRTFAWAWLCLWQAITCKLYSHGSKEAWMHPKLVFTQHLHGVIYLLSLTYSTQGLSQCQQASVPLPSRSCMTCMLSCSTIPSA